MNRFQALGTASACDGRESDRYSGTNRMFRRNRSQRAKYLSCREQPGAHVVGQLSWSGFELPLSEGQGERGKTGKTGEDFDLFRRRMPVSQSVPAAIKEWLTSGKKLREDPFPTPVALPGTARASHPASRTSTLSAPGSESSPDRRAVPSRRASVARLPRSWSAIPKARDSKRNP